MPSIADVYVTILPETSRVADGIRRSLRSLDDDFYRSGRRWGGEIKRGLGDVGIDIDANTARARREIASLDKDIGRKRKIEVDIDHDKSSFGALATGARTIEQNFKSLAITAAAVPNTIASVGTAAAQLSGVIGLMPAGIGAAALAFGSLKVATMGFGDAMKNIGDPAKFSEAIKQLSPNAQQAATAIQGLMPQINQLKMTVQDAFFAGFGDQIKQLGSTYLPMFQGVMSQMAGSANKALTSVSEMLKQPAMVGDMSTMTGNMSSAFNILSQALAPVVKAFMDIGVVGSGFLPALAQAATQAATAFATFIEKARGSGQLQEWIQTGIDAFKQLMDIVGNVGGLIMGIMKAAPPGGGLLGTLASLTQMLTDFVNSPAGQGALTTFMTTMKDTMAALMPAVGALLQALAPVLGLLGQFSGMIIQSLAPALQMWFEAMTPVIQQIVGALKPVLAALGPQLANIAMILAQQMVDGIQQILPHLVPFVYQMGQLLVALLPLLPQIVQLATSALPLFTTACAAILPPLTDVMNMLTWAANTVMPMVGGAVDLLSGIFTSRWREISGAVELAFTVIRPILQTLTDLIQRFLDGPFGRFAKLVAATMAPLATLVGGNLPSTAAAPSGLPPLGTPAAVPGQMALNGGPATVGSRGRVPGRKAGTASQTTMPNVSAGLPGAPTPPVSSYVAPAPSSGGGAGGGGGNTPAALSPSGVDWDKIAEKESQGHWDLNSGNGYYGGLQFNLATWKEFGGLDFAERPDLATREQQIAVAERVPQNQRANRWPNTYSAGAVGRPPAGSAAAATDAGSTAYSAAMPEAYGLASGTNTGGYGTGTGATFPQWVMDLGAQFGVTPSTYPGHQESNRNEPGYAPNPQHLNRGIDWTGSPQNMQKFAEYLATLPEAEQVIFNGPGGAVEAVAGQRRPGYFAGDLAGHGTHVHSRFAQSPVSAGYPDTTSGGYTGDYSDYSGFKSTREAEQRVADTQQRIADEEDKLAKLRMKPGATPEDIARQERDVAKARREHADALNDLTAAQNKYNDAAGGNKGEGGFSGQDFMAGIAEFFGFDGTLFKNPAEFGLIKFLGAASKLKPAGGDGASTPSLGEGGGGSGLTGLLSMVPQAFGALNPAASENAPGQFMPAMPGADSGGVLGRAFAPAGAPGPGNAIDNSVNVYNPIGQDHLQSTFETAQREQYPRVRQSNRHNP